jgi:hypothetical protein
MIKLKLGSLLDDKPVKLSIELPPSVHRDLVAYAEVLARETGQSIAEADRANAGAVHGDGPGLCESAADVVIDSRVTSLGTCVAQAPE